MFQALLAHLHEALHKLHFVYCVRVCQLAATRLGAELTHKITKCRLLSTS
jgi:hypothetical protein